LLGSAAENRLRPTSDVSVPTPIDVVLERDGVFPRFEQLLAQIDRARVALARGRARAASGALSHARWETQTSTTTRKKAMLT
jgi:hypothetical protein